MTKNEFDNLIAELQQAFHKSYSPRELRVLWNRLYRIEAATLGKAVDVLIEQSPRKPMVADIFSALPNTQAPYEAPPEEPMSKEEARDFMRKMRAAWGAEPKKEKAILPVRPPANP